jgi:hypothetical protein
MVWLTTTGIPPTNHDKLLEGLQGFGISLEEFLESPEWMLGYIPRNVACLLTLPDDTPATLAFNTQGKPLAIFTLTTPIN